MKFEGRVCVNCDKGKLRAYKDEVAEGIYVDAYKCDYCNQIIYSREVMSKVEAMHKSASEERRLVRVGSSVAALIPASIVKAMSLKPREKIFVTTQGNRIIILPSPA